MYFICGILMLMIYREVFFLKCGISNEMYAVEDDADYKQFSNSKVAISEMSNEDSCCQTSDNIHGEISMSNEY